MKEALKIKAFTLLETLVAVVVVTVLASVAVSVYTGYRDRVAMMVDETNQKILQAAVKIAAASTGSVAGSLSELRPDDVTKAYALVTEGKRPYTLWAHLQQLSGEFWDGSVARAYNFLPAQFYGRNLKTITCPFDPTPPTGFDAQGRPTGGKSYSIHPAFRGKPYSFLSDPAKVSKVLIIECDDSGDNREFRHQGKTAQIETSVNGTRGKRITASTATGNQNCPTSAVSSFEEDLENH